jgi:hypothetical protein
LAREEATDNNNYLMIGDYISGAVLNAFCSLSNLVLQNLHGEEVKA